MIQGFLKHNVKHEAKGTGFKWNPTDTTGVAKCLRANAALAPTDNTIDETQDEDYLIVGGMQKHQSIKKDGICTTLTASMGTGGGYVPMVISKDDNLLMKEAAQSEPTIQRIDIPQMVSVRKYEVDKEKLVETLRHQKKLCGWTNKDLAEELQLPVTTVEHWFRTDKHFGIPDPEIWSDLKWLLEMDDIDEFDEAIMTFEDRVYSPEGTARTLMGEGGNNTDKTGRYIMPNLRIRRLTPKECFRLMGFDDKDCDVLVENKISNTQLYKMAGNSIVVDVLEEIFVELLNQYDDVFPMR